MSIPKILDFDDYNHYPADANPTTDADMQDYMGNQNSVLQNVTSSYLWQPQTAYVVNQEVHSPNLPAGYMAVCVTAGTSGTSEPSWASGTLAYTDGTVTWNITSLYDGKVDKTDYAKEIGMVFAFAGANAPSGYLFCDGSLVSRTDYKALYNVIGTSYGAGDGSTTFALPNLVDKFIQGNATVGSVKSAGLPNLVGSFSVNNIAGSFYPIAITDPAGVFGFWEGEADVSSTGGNTPSITTKNHYRGNFNAGKYNSIYGNSATVQPPAVTMQYIIRYE